MCHTYVTVGEHVILEEPEAEGLLVQEGTGKVVDWLTDNYSNAKAYINYSSSWE